MKIGIMQPYFLPYIGYFALINAVDKFVYLNDVQYIKRGWVNRNRVKMMNNWLYITLPIKKAPLSAKINEIYVVDNEKAIKKIKETIKHCYSKAPNYIAIKELVLNHLYPDRNISTLNIDLTKEICKYLGIHTELYNSSELKIENSLKGVNKLIAICKNLGGTQYINPIGGIELYSKEEFLKENINLNFLRMSDIFYPQGNYQFIPNLSIIDVLMFNEKEKIIELLNNYELI